MTDIERKMLSLLAGNGAGLRAAGLGALLWAKHNRSPQSYARPAGAVLRRLEKRRLVYVAFDTRGFCEWFITDAGRRALKAAIKMTSC